MTETISHWEIAVPHFWFDAAQPTADNVYHATFRRGIDNSSRMLMNRFAVVLVVAFLHATNACGQSIRIATYNLNWGNRRGDQVLDAIATADPDLICFQETTVQSERFLRDRLTETHPHFHSIGHEGRYGAERFSFASKIELTNLSFVPPKAGLFGFYSARLQIAEFTVHVVSVHLAPFQFQRGGGIGDAMAALSRTEEVHTTETAAVVKAVDPKVPTVIVGDFNSLSTFHAPTRLAELGFIDAYASVHEDADTHPTWHWPTRPLPLALRIDYIFHTPHFTTTEAMVIRRQGSDHSLVLAELELTEQRRPLSPTTTRSPNGASSLPVESLAP